MNEYGLDLLSKGSGVLDVAGGNGDISRALHELGIPSTLLDPDPRCYNDGSEPPFGVLKYALNGDGSDLTNRNDHTGHIVRNSSLICGLHPDQATDPIVELALKMNLPFAIVPCCVMPSLFPHRRQKRQNADPVRSYSSYCQYLLDLAPDGVEFRVDHLPFVGRNKIIYSKPSRFIGRCVVGD